MSALSSEDKVVLLLRGLSEPVMESVLGRLPAEQGLRLRTLVKQLGKAPLRSQDMTEAAREVMDLLRIAERPPIAPPRPEPPPAKETIVEEIPPAEEEATVALADVPAEVLAQ